MGRAVRVLIKLVRCPFRLKKLLLESAVSLACAHLSIRLLSFKRLAGRLVCPPDAIAGSTDSEGSISEIAWAIDRTARILPLPIACFARAVAAQAMCRRRGIETTLHYGASAATGSLQAHVWLNYREIGIVGHELAGEYKLLASFASRKRSARIA